MKFYNIITLFFLILFSQFSNAQYGWRDGNRIGLLGGVNMSSLYTSAIDSKSELGWTAGMQVRGNMYNEWSGAFGIRFIESNFSVATKSLYGQANDVKYSLNAAQIHFIFSYNVFDDVMSLDIGPMLQINGDLKFKKGLENYRIENSNLLVKDIKEITPFNGLIYVGTTIGTRVVRLNVNYTLSVNNMFNRLNNQEGLVEKNNNENFTARMGVVSGQLQINL